MDHLLDEGVLVYPTETVYGMGCLARPGALERLFGLKKRDPDKPVLLLVSERSHLRGLSWTEPGRRLAEAFWPGPVTLILADPRAHYPPGVRSPEGGVGVRESPHPLVRSLLDELQEPLTSTSANGPGEPPSRSGEEALEVVSELGGGAETWVLDAGALEPSSPSTVVDCTGPEPFIRRPGAVSSEEISKVLEASS